MQAQLYFTCYLQVHSIPESGSSAARPGSGGPPTKAGKSAVTAAPAVQGGSPGAQKAAAAAWKQQQDAKTNAASRAPEVQADRFAKFTIVADPAPLWRRAVEELAEHAAQVRRWLALVALRQHQAIRFQGSCYGLTY
jgi:hypothetical protein